MTQTHEEMTSSVRFEPWWMCLAQSLNRKRCWPWMFSECAAHLIRFIVEDDRCVIWCLYCLHLSGHQSDLTELLSVFTGCVQSEPSEQVWHSSSRGVHALKTVLNQKPVVYLDPGSPHSVLAVSSTLSKSLISCFRCVWLGLELNSAGHRPSRTGFGDRWLGPRLCQQGWNPYIFRAQTWSEDYFKHMHNYKLAYYSNRSVIKLLWDYRRESKLF